MQGTRRPISERSSPPGSEDKLNDYLAAWQLANPQLLTQTLTSHIYTVTHENETVVFKLLSSAETEEQRGAVSLHYFAGRGAVRLLRYDDGAQLENGVGLVRQLLRIAALFPFVERGLDCFLGFVQIGLGTAARD